MKTKNLIEDILKYLKDNKEARERFNDILYSEKYYGTGKQSYLVYKKGLGTAHFDDDGFEHTQYYKLDELTDCERMCFLNHALASPNGKPICGFLEEECDYPNCQDGHYPLGEYENGDIDWGGCPQCVKDEVRIFPVNHAKTLRTIYLDALDEGESHDDAYKLINKEYNKI